MAHQGSTYKTSSPSLSLPPHIENTPRLPPPPHHSISTKIILGENISFTKDPCTDPYVPQCFFQTTDPAVLHSCGCCSPHKVLARSLHPTLPLPLATCSSPAAPAVLRSCGPPMTAVERKTFGEATQLTLSSTLALAIVGL